MTYGTLYKFFETDINIQNDIQAISRVFENKSKIIEKYKESQFYNIRKDEVKRPQTACGTSTLTKPRQKSLLSKISDLEESYPTPQKGPQNPYFSYNNLMNSENLIQPSAYKNLPRTLKYRRRSKPSQFPSSDPKSLQNPQNHQKSQNFRKSERISKRETTPAKCTFTRLNLSKQPSNSKPKRPLSR